MIITAMFSEWLLSDGIVEPLSIGQTISAEFELENAREIRRSVGLHFDLRDAQCQFSGEVKEKYVSKSKHGVVVSVGPLAFFLDSNDTHGFSIGDKIAGEGVLSFDWRRRLSTIGIDGFDQPDISRLVRIVRIRRAHASDFVVLGPNGVFRRRSHPSPRFVDVQNMDENSGAGNVLVVDAVTLDG